MMRRPAMEPTRMIFAVAPSAAWTGARMPASSARSTPLMMSKNKFASNSPATPTLEAPAAKVAEMEGVVVPVAPATTPKKKSKPNLVRPAAWNPQGLTKLEYFVPLVDFEAFAVPEYLTQAPPYLDGSLAADVGFDPLGLAALARPDASAASLLTAKARGERMAAMSEDEQQAAVAWMRESEIKHARLAMLAAAGWPMAELVNGPLLKELGTNGRAQSLFNGHLLDGAVAFLELTNLDKTRGVTKTDYGFDPLGYATNDGPAIVRKLQAAELKNGRLAMMAITGFAVQEFLYGNAVVEQTPWFFGR